MTKPGAEIRRLRREAGASQEKLAETVGCSLRHLGEIERSGNCPPRILPDIVQALNKLRKPRGLPLVPPNLYLSEPPISNWLNLPMRQWSRESHGPGALLTADYRVVPFHGDKRLKERDDLVAWCLGSEHCGIRVYKGEGGSGKTRLALAVCDLLKDHPYGSWEVGFAQTKHFPIGRNIWTALPDLSLPFLIVVDYAGEERKAQMIQDLLQSVEECPAPKVRLLFLERDDHWLDRAYSDSRVRNLLLGPKLFRSREGVAAELKPMASTPAERTDSFNKATQAFSELLGVNTRGLSLPRLSGPLYSRVLFIHIQALLHVFGEAGSGKTQVLEHLFHREREYWKQRIAALGLSLHLLPAVEEAVHRISLGEGVPDPTAALQRFRGSPILADQPEIVLVQIAALLRECYPHGEHGIGPLQPDMLRDFLTAYKQ